jgi:hypothetical protein
VRVGGVRRRGARQAHRHHPARDGEEVQRAPVRRFFCVFISKNGKKYFKIIKMVKIIILKRIANFNLIINKVILYQAPGLINHPKRWKS